MRSIDVYALAASAVTLFVTLYVAYLFGLPRPQRGFGGAQLLVVGMAVVVGVVLHGSIVSGVALFKGRTSAAWTAAALHVLVILAGVVKAFRS